MEAKNDPARKEMRQKCAEILKTLMINVKTI